MQLLSMVEILIEKLTDFISGDVSIHQRVILCIEAIKACHRLISLYHQPKNMFVYWELQVARLSLSFKVLSCSLMQIEWLLAIPL